MNNNIEHAESEKEGFAWCGIVIISGASKKTWREITCLNCLSTGLKKYKSRGTIERYRIETIEDTIKKLYRVDKDELETLIKKLDL